MSLAAPPPDRQRSPTRPGRRRRGSTTAPLTPAAVAGMALLLALATLRQPPLVVSTEAAWSDSVHFTPSIDQAGDRELMSAVSLKNEAAGGRAELQPVAATEGVATDPVAVDGPATFDETSAGAIELQLASRLAWQVTGSFTFAPFAGVWAGELPSASATDSAVVVQ